MINIYHFSNTKIKDYIDPSFFGFNFYTDNSKKISSIKRSFFYLNLQGREQYFYGARFLYTSKVNEKKLYNISTDPLSIVKKLKYYNDIYKEVKKRGYIGLIGNNNLLCAILFKKVKIIKRMDLTK